MGRILTHDRLHVNSETLCHLAIMYVNKTEKKRKREEMEDQQAELPIVCIVLGVCRWLLVLWGGVGHGFWCTCTSGLVTYTPTNVLKHAAACRSTAKFSWGPLVLAHAHTALPKPPVSLGENFATFLTDESFPRNYPRLKLSPPPLCMVVCPFAVNWQH